MRMKLNFSSRLMILAIQNVKYPKLNGLKDYCINYLTVLPMLCNLRKSGLWTLNLMV